MDELRGRCISVIFDGTSEVAETVAILFRCVRLLFLSYITVMISVTNVVFIGFLAGLLCRVSGPGYL